MSGGQRPQPDEPATATEPTRPTLIEVAGDGAAREVLQRIAQAARELSDAQYAALAVVGADRTVVDLITDGLPEPEVARIETYPRAHGILGDLIDDPRPIRLRRIGDHPSAQGFPPITHG